MIRSLVTGTGPVLHATRATLWGGTRYAYPLSDLGRFGRKGCNGLSQASERADSIEWGRNSPVLFRSTCVNGLEVLSQ